MNYAPQISELPIQYRQAPQLTKMTEAELRLANSIRNMLIQKETYENRPDVFVVLVQPNVYAVGEKGVVDFFFDGKGECIFNIKSISTSYGFDKVAAFAGYREIKGKNGNNQLYSILDIDIETGKPLAGKKEISNTSPEYYKAWQDINFFSDRADIVAYSSKRPDSTFKPLSDKVEALENMIESGAVTLCDLETIFDQGQITQQVFLKLMPLVQQRLILQISDPRFSKFQKAVSGVRRSVMETKDINRLESKGYISPELAKAAREAIIKRDAHQKQREGVHQKTASLLQETIGTVGVTSNVQSSIQTMDV